MAGRGLKSQRNPARQLSECFGECTRTKEGCNGTMLDRRLPVKCLHFLILIAAIFVASLPAFGQVYSDLARDELFWASHRLAQEKSALPTRQIGLFTTTMGTDGSTPVNWGGKLEAALADGIWVTLEAVYLGEDEIDGFASLKIYPDRSAVPLYAGVGAGLKDGFGYQVFAGVELLKRFYVEVKYAGTDGNFHDGTPSLAAGFILSF